MVTSYSFPDQVQNQAQASTTMNMSSPEEAEQQPATIEPARRSTSTSPSRSRRGPPPPIPVRSSSRPRSHPQVALGALAVELPPVVDTTPATAEVCQPERTSHAAMSNMLSPQPTKSPVAQDQTKDDRFETTIRRLTIHELTARQARVNFLLRTVSTFNQPQTDALTRVWLNTLALSQRTMDDGTLIDRVGDVRSGTEREDRDRFNENRWRYAWVTGDPEARTLQRFMVGRRGKVQESEAQHTLRVRLALDVDAQLEREREEREMAVAAAQWAIYQAEGEEFDVGEAMPELEFDGEDHEDDNEAGDRGVDDVHDHGEPAHEVNIQDDQDDDFNHSHWTATASTSMESESTSDSVSNSGWDMDLAATNESTQSRGRSPTARRVTSTSTSPDQDRNRQEQERPQTPTPYQRRESLASYWRRRAQRRGNRQQQQQEPQLRHDDEEEPHGQSGEYHRILAELTEDNQHQR